MALRIQYTVDTITDLSTLGYLTEKKNEQHGG